MSREIKFRVWYDKSQTWVYFNIGQTFTVLAYKIYVELCIEVAKFYQFSGLQDKNGKEIYEGDLLETKHGNIITVEDLEYIFLWRYENHYAWSSITNIGNIHENPELLNK